MEVLWLSNETPDRFGQGGQRRQYFQIRALVAAGHRVQVVTLGGPQDDTSVRELAPVRRLESHWKGRVPRVQFAWEVRRLLRAEVDRIVIAHIESWPIFGRHLDDRSPPVLLDLHNVLGAAPTTDAPRHDGAGWRRIELAAAGRVDVVAVCSERERERLGPVGKPVIVLPHGVEPSEWRAEPLAAAKPVVKAFGNWRWGPNARGLQWFLEEVAPLARQRRDFDIHVAGVGAPASNDPAVRYLGRVPHLDRFLSDAWAVAVPVRNGVGAPVKYAEALATGVPVIATVDGAPQPGADLISDDPCAWSDWLETAISSPPAPLVPSLRADRLKLLSWAESCRGMERWINGVA